MKLDLTSLEKAIKALGDSLEVYGELKEGKSVSGNLLKTVKSGVIQNFEVAYELCWKFMRRWIDENVTPGLGDGATRKELYRLAAENGLLQDVEEWFDYHKSRNITAHTYDEENVEKALVISGKFHRSALDFFSRIEAHND